ncbi:hypothetical protein NKI77_14230 [Mesorhizobium opportunistum]|uniref:Uncharacterized protein n=1 Tax=Mesorhizobium opportunistum TaxID=593909 RepID=A0ABV1YG55_9HYPH|nr:hypothetical protein [Mesorhizobium sp.]TIN93307.1 MAG: hypothetical protein E5Y06_20425 [Mesorhizobium sp.]TJU95572.1 MAG: hypothetical protein E5Y08_24880 [Mesorhizobium sp.]TJV17552.1 MAG: hypothetical protein E5Y07_13330 [Mesorhizobium sp.]
MIPDHYAVVYTEESRRIFVIISEIFGDFVLTKSCSGPNCGCIGCMMLSSKVIRGEAEFSVVDLDGSQSLDENLMAHSFTKEGEIFLLGLKRKYKAYKGSINKEKLDKIFRFPDAVLIIKHEEDGTFTHSYVSPIVVRRVISRGCRATPHCPCVGCRIVDMWYTKAPGHMTPAVDISEGRVSAEGELILPIFEGDEIISKMLTRDPSVRHDFSPNIFDSPLEQMF